MGAVFRTDLDTGEHVTTGKAPFVGGERHTPEWSDWRNEGPMQMRSCTWFGGVDGGGCDLDDYRSYPAST